MAQPAPGWFPDPFDPARQRWWDGRQWTTHLRGEALRPERTASDPRDPTSGARHRRTRVATVALVSAGALLAGAATATAAGLLAFVPSGRGGASQAAPVAPTTSPTATPVGATAPQAAQASPAAPVRRSTTPVRPSVGPVATPVPASSPTPSRSPTSTAGLVPVVSVTDGDTIRVRVGGVTHKVRVIGLDTPELRTDGCHARQAASRMQSLVQGRQVRLSRDPSQADRDRSGRLLRHVALPDGRQVAQLLIGGGFGEELTHDRGYAGQAAYRSAERAARHAGRGIWGHDCTALDRELGVGRGSTDRETQAGQLRPGRRPS